MLVNTIVGQPFPNLPFHHITVKNRFINYSVKEKPGRQLKNNTGVFVMEDRNGRILLSYQFNVIFCVRQDMTLQPINIAVPAIAFANIIKEGYDGLVKDKKGNEW